jgi:poly(3-hydroxybutyrate) depolymerase
MTKNTPMDADAEKEQLPVTYPDEILCANWHPLVLLLAEPLTKVRKTLDEVDAADLLARLYSSQRP